MLGNLDFKTLGLLIAALGEDTVRRAITVPMKTLEAQAKKNKDDVSEFVAKRDTWVDATIDFAKEFANLDND